MKFIYEKKKFKKDVLILSLLLIFIYEATLIHRVKHIIKERGCTLCEISFSLNTHSNESNILSFIESNILGVIKRTNIKSLKSSKIKDQKPLVKTIDFLNLHIFFIKIITKGYNSNAPPYTTL